MALAVCLLPDAHGQRALRGLWRRIEELGVPSMSSHTHGHHVPHLSYAVLREYDVTAVRDALAALADGGPLGLSLNAVACAPRGRVWLMPAAHGDLLRRQRQVVTAVLSTGAELHRHYRPGQWLPHLSLVPRARLDELPVVVEAANSVLPMAMTTASAALIDSGTGERWPLPAVP